ncbi:MAG TPA: DUF1761 domain-containing protein [Methyloceanibacter sp.]|nr:DUF1761 domain-containing protein [Methyloceanibacter sp.]
MTPIMVNYLAIIIAALAGLGLGLIWRMVMLKPWLAARGKTKADIEGRGLVLPFLTTFVALLVMAWMLAGVMVHMGQVTVRGGLITSFLVWLGFVITVIGVSHAFTGAKPLLTLIDGAYWLAALLIMGAVIGAFGV